MKSGIIEVENTYPDLDYPEYHKLIYDTFLLKNKNKNKKNTLTQTQTPTPSHRTQFYIANGKHVFCAQPTELVSYLLADS